MAQGYIGVPPDSTGKRVATTPISVVSYTNGTAGLMPGLTIVGATSNGTGTISSITKDPSGTSGEIYIKGLTAQLLSGEALNIGGTQVATAAANSIDLHMQVVNIGDTNNPDHTVKVSENGALKVVQDNYNIHYDTFGAQTALGRSPISMINKDTWGRVALQEASANSTISATTHGEALTMTTGTAVADFCRISSKVPIHTNLFSGKEASTYFTVMSEDAGKAGVVRRFGVYSDTDGAFFQLNGTSLELGIKSSISGTVQETIFGVVDWNAGNPVNRLLAQYGPPTIDVTKINTFWMTISDSHVLWGVVTSANEHQIVHIYTANNTTALPLFKTEGWRIVVEQYNTTVQALASSMQFFQAYCFAKGIEYEEMVMHNSSDLGTATTPLNITGTESGLAAIRLSATNPQAVHRGALIEKMRVLASGGDVILRVYKGASITGATWTAVPNSVVEYTTGFSAGVTVSTATAEVINVHIITQGSVAEYNDEPNQTNMFVNLISKDLAGGDYNMVYITGQCLPPSTAATAVLTLGWDEII